MHLQSDVAWCGVQVSGEDLTPYRHASKQMWELLQQFGTVQRGGMDEAYLDATAEVRGT